MARFERSTLLEHKLEGTRTVVLRFLKIITPVKCVVPLYDGSMRCPKEGELYMKYGHRSLPSWQLWSVNIDKLKGPTNTNVPKSLQLLWDA